MTFVLSLIIALCLYILQDLVARNMWPDRYGPFMRAYWVFTTILIYFIVTLVV